MDEYMSSYFDKIMYEKMDKERFDESEQWFILRDLKAS